MLGVHLQWLCPLLCKTREKAPITRIAKAKAPFPYRIFDKSESRVTSTPGMESGWFGSK